MPPLALTDSQHRLADALCLISGRSLRPCLTRSAPFLGMIAGAMGNVRASVSLPCGPAPVSIYDLVHTGSNQPTDSADEAINLIFWKSNSCLTVIALQQSAKPG